jgi:hypothetical protein
MVTYRMPRILVYGPEDPRLAEYRGVREADLVRAAGLFVAEGRLVVERVISDGRFAIRSILLNRAACRGSSLSSRTCPLQYQSMSARPTRART